MSTNILYGNSAVTQNEIFNTFFVGIRARWARSPWALQVGAGHSSLFKFCHPSVHIAVVQSTIPTNWDKFTININTVSSFAQKHFIMARCSSRANSIIISMKIVTETTFQFACTGPWRLTGGFLQAQSQPLLPPLAWLQQQLLYSHNKNLCITSGLHHV